MSDEHAKFKPSLFNIRNLILGSTVILVLSVIALVAFVFVDAQKTKDSANTSMQVNSFAESISKMGVAIATERAVFSTAFGYEDVPDAYFLAELEKQRAEGKRFYDAATAALKQLPDYASLSVAIALDSDPENAPKADIKKKFEAAWKNYEKAGEPLKNMLSLNRKGRRETYPSLSSATASHDALLEASWALRMMLEANTVTSNPRIEAAKQFKRNLYQILTFSSESTAALGTNIAARSKISGFKSNTISKYEGQLLSAWNNTKKLALSGQIDDQTLAAMANIQKIFIKDYEDYRNTVFEASSSYDEFDDTENKGVAYPVSGRDWLEEATRASKPVRDTFDSANALALRLNEAAVAEANAALFIAVTGLIISLALGIGAGWVVIARVVRPIAGLSNTMQLLASGELETEVPHTTGRDEIGDMARSVQVFKENAIERQTLEAENREREMAEQQRRADEERRAHETQEAQRLREEKQAEDARAERRKAMLELADHFERSVMGVVESVSQSASQMEQAAKGMTETAGETAKKTELVSKVAEQTSSNINMVASAAEELSSSVREITQQTNLSSTSARDAVARTENASKDVAMLENAASKIGDVVKLINDIAEQTNLLALNATIEAARAGEAGKGFAVVASEVKSLANQTANATQEISDQVSSMQQATNTAVRAMEQIREIIRDIDSTAVSIASAVEQQDASTQEIARNVAEVSSGTVEVTTNIHSVHEGANSTGAAAWQVLSSARALTEQSTNLRSQVQSFLSQIRA